MMFWNDTSFGVLCKNVNKMKVNQGFKVKLNELRSFFYMNVGKEAHFVPLWEKMLTLFCCDNQK